jgi:murein DD-endopeptidase MepM/ murein hydrolase activator NlpD
VRFRPRPADRLAAVLVLAASSLGPTAVHAAPLGSAIILSDDPVLDAILPRAGSGQPPTVTTYVAVAGDSLKSVARSHGIDLATLLGANPGVALHPDHLDVGDLLRIPPTHGVVATADGVHTLGQLAGEHAADSGMAATYNRARPDQVLPAGREVVLPRATPDLPAVARAALAQVAAEDLAEHEASTLSVAGAGTSTPLPTAVQPYRAVWPVEGRLSTPFGAIGPLSPHGHTGIDIAAPSGAPIVSDDAGVVRTAGWNTGGYGNLVVVVHSDGFETWYGHLSAFSVRVGQTVGRGDPIGRVGSTGLSTGPHLHWEVRSAEGQRLNPLRFLVEGADR